MANDPMRILKADHREVEKLLDKLAESDEGAEREQMVDELVTKLTAHMEAEESIVYPPVKREVGEEDEEEAQIEHGLAREGLSKVQQMVEMPGFGAAVEMLKGGISHHVEEEETQLLPELKEKPRARRVASDRRCPRGSKEVRRAPRPPIASTQVDQAHQERQAHGTRLMRAAVWHGRRDVRVETVARSHDPGDRPTRSSGSRRAVCAVPICTCTR